MRTVNEYRPGRWALLEAGAVVATTTDPAEARAWLPREPEDLVSGPLFAGDLRPLGAGQATAVTQDAADPAPALVSHVASQVPQDTARDEMTRATVPAYLWLAGPGGADLPTVQAWWGAALASWRRRSGRAEGLPAETKARADLVQALRQVTPAAVRLVECQTVQAGTAWLGPV